VAYKIKLEIFEGPFEITEQFLEYIELMKILDLEIAGEFIEMVAMLMNIKARMLLPKSVGMSDEEYEDPRTELVERIIEYKKFKEAASEISAYESNRRKLFSRKSFEKYFVKKDISTEEYLNDISLFDLLLALKKALDNMPKITEHQVTRIDVTIEQQTEYILNKFASSSAILFSELINKLKEKIVIIVTFMALLDLINKRQLTVKQSENFDEIRIKLIK